MVRWSPGWLHLAVQCTAAAQWWPADFALSCGTVPVASVSQSHHLVWGQEQEGGFEQCSSCRRAPSQEEPTHSVCCAQPRRLKRAAHTGQEKLFLPLEPERRKRVSGSAEPQYLSSFQKTSSNWLTSTGFQSKTQGTVYIAPLICCTDEILKKQKKPPPPNNLQKLNFHLVYLYIFKLHVSVCAKHQQSVQDLDDNKCNVNYILIVTHS